MTSSSSSLSNILLDLHSILPNKLLREFMHDPIKTLMDIAHTYGDIAHFKFGRQHIYLINNPHYIEDILIRNYKNFIKSRGLQVSKRLLGEGLVTSEGEYHDRQRRIIQPSISSQSHKEIRRHHDNLCCTYVSAMGGWNYIGYT